MIYQVLARLRTARQVFDTPNSEIDLTMPGPRQPSIYEAELAEPHLRTSPLPLPPPHVFDSAPMRPVSVAIQDGVSLLFGGAGHTYIWLSWRHWKGREIGVWTSERVQSIFGERPCSRICSVKVCGPLRLSMADTSKLQEQLIDVRKKLAG